MLLLLPILVPLIGGIFVFRQKNETYRDWLVVTLIVITRCHLGMDWKNPKWSGDCSISHPK